MAALLNRLKNLESRLNPFKAKPALIFCDDFDEIDVDGVMVYRNPGESDNSYFDRVAGLYESGNGNAPSLIVRISAPPEELMQA